MNIDQKNTYRSKYIFSLFLIVSTIACAQFPAYTFVNYVDSVSDRPSNTTIGPASYLTDHLMNTKWLNVGSTNVAPFNVPGSRLLLTWNNPLTDNPGNDIGVVTGTPGTVTPGNNGTADVRFRLSNGVFTALQTVNFDIGIISSTLTVNGTTYDCWSNQTFNHSTQLVMTVFDIGTFYSGPLSITGIEFSNLTTGWLDLALVAGIQDNTVGIHTISEKTISIGPNPMFEMIEIKGISEKSNLKLFNKLGLLVKSMSLGNETVVDVSDLESGLYSMKIIDNDGNTIITKKIIKL